MFSIFKLFKKKVENLVSFYNGIYDQPLDFSIIKAFQRLTSVNAEKRWGREECKKIWLHNIIEGVIQKVRLLQNDVFLTTHPMPHF